jgi:hypothetical protein
MVIEAYIDGDLRGSREIADRLIKPIPGVERVVFLEFRRWLIEKKLREFQEENKKLFNKDVVIIYVLVWRPKTR